MNKLELTDALSYTIPQYLSIKKEKKKEVSFNLFLNSSLFYE